MLKSIIDFYNLTERKMKRLLSIILTLFMLVPLVASVVPVQAVTHGFVRGDADDDSHVSMKDVILIRSCIAGLYSYSSICRIAADVVEDDSIDMKDVLQIRYMLAGIEPYEGNNTDGEYKVDEIKIGGRNIARFTIVYPDSVPEGSGAYLASMKFAAEELRDQIKGACGISLNIAYESNAPKGNLIRYKYDLNNEYDLGKEGFIIETTDTGDLIFTCGTMRGALYGTYTFLEDMIGYRYMTGYVNYLYESKLVNVPLGYYDREVPAFEYRSIGMNGPSQNYAKLRINGIDGDAKTTPENGGGVNPVFPHAHSFVYQMAGWDHWKDTNLTDTTTQPCLTDEETYNKIIDFDYKLINYYQELKGLTLGYDFTHVPCSQNDSGTFCPCERCKAVYAEEGSIAGPLIRLSNRVAEKICADYPMLGVYTVVYYGTQVVPKATRPNKDVTICFCNVGCNNHLLRDQDACVKAGGNHALALQINVTPEEYGLGTDPITNGAYMDWLKGWLELTDNVWFWYYCTVFYHFASPSPNLFNFCDDVKYLSELGVKGIYMEGNHVYMDYNFEFMRAYLLCKVLWDPGMSEEEYQGYMDEYLWIVFGDGWEKVKQYIYMTNYAADLKGCWTNNFNYFWDYYDKQYFTDHYEEMRTLLTEARSEAKQGSQSVKCGNAMISLDFLGLSATYERDWVNGSDESRATYKERYEQLWKKYHDGGIIENPFGTGTGGMANFPSTSSNPVDPMKWIGATFTGEH